MEDIKLIKEDDSEYTQKLKYKYIMSNNTMERLIEKSNAIRSIKNLPLITFNNEIEEYEFFKRVFPYKYNEDIQNYFLVIDNIPVSLITVVLKKDNDIELSFSTSKKYLRHGYATLAVELIEKEYFSNTNIKDIIMIDVSKNGETTLIANKLGYKKNENREYHKRNPNYKVIIK